MTQLAARVRQRGLLRAFVIVLLGVGASHVFLWARDAFNLVGGDPRTGWGNAILWCVTLVFLAVCAGIGAGSAGATDLGQTSVAIIVGMGAEWVLEAVLPGWPQLLRSDGIFAAVPVVAGGFGSMAAGYLIRDRSDLAGGVSLALSSVIVLGAAWVLLFFE